MKLHKQVNNQDFLDECYRSGLRHLNQGDWQAAIAAFAELQAAGDLRPEVDGMLAEARLKLKFEEVERPVALMPPSRSWPMRALLIVALFLASAGVFKEVVLDASRPAVVSAATQVKRSVAASPKMPSYQPAPAAAPASPQSVAAVLPPASRAPAPIPGTILVQFSDGATPSTLSYHLLTTDGVELTRGTVGYGRRIEVPAGSYKLKIDAAEAIEKDLAVDGGATVEVRLRQGYSGWVAEVAVSGGA